MQQLQIWYLAKLSVIFIQLVEPHWGQWLPDSEIVNIIEKWGTPTPRLNADVDYTLLAYLFIWVCPLLPMVVITGRNQVKNVYQANQAIADKSYYSDQSTFFSRMKTMSGAIDCSLGRTYRIQGWNCRVQQKITYGPEKTYNETQIEGICRASDSRLLKEHTLSYVSHKAGLQAHIKACHSKTSTCQCPNECQLNQIPQSYIKL